MNVVCNVDLENPIYLNTNPIVSEKIQILFNNSIISSKIDEVNIQLNKSIFINIVNKEFKKYGVIQNVIQNNRNNRNNKFTNTPIIFEFKEGVSEQVIESIKLLCSQKNIEQHNQAIIIKNITDEIYRNGILSEPIYVYYFPTFINVENNIVDIKNSKYSTIAIKGELNGVEMIAGYLQYNNLESYINIEHVEIRSKFRKLGLCGKLIEFLVHKYNDTFRTFKLYNAGGLASFKCYTNTFRKLNFKITTASKDIAELNNLSRKQNTSNNINTYSNTFTFTKNNTKSNTVLKNFNTSRKRTNSNFSNSQKSKKHATSTED